MGRGGMETAEAGRLPPALAGIDSVLHQLVLGLNEVSSVGRARARARDVILVGPRGVGKTVTSSTYGALAAQAPDDPASGPARPEGAPVQVGLDLPECLDQLLSSRGFLDRHPSRPAVPSSTTGADALTEHPHPQRGTVVPAQRPSSSQQ